MTERVTRHRLQVAAELDRFISEQALPGTGLDADAFWAGVDAVFHDLTPKNRELLVERDRLQERLDAWHRENPG
ncbi:MAG: malate synthase G, partial [Halomonas sp.]